MSRQHVRGDVEPPLVEIASHDVGRVRLGKDPLECTAPAFRAVLAGGLATLLGTAGADDLVHRPAGIGIVPTVLFPDQHQPGSGAALPAIIRARAVAIVEAEAISSAAKRTRAMPVAQELRVDAEPRQDLEPAASGSFDRAHGARAHDAAAFA